MSRSDVDDLERAYVLAHARWMHTPRWRLLARWYRKAEWGVWLRALADEVKREMQR